MINCRIKYGAQWSKYVASSACQLSCLAYHQEAGRKQHLSVAKIDWNFKKPCLATALYLFSITAYHLNFMGQILGWARIANFAEKERTKWIIFIFTARYFWINLFLIAILCFISYKIVFAHRVRWPVTYTAIIARAFLKLPLLTENLTKKLIARWNMK